MFSEDFLIPKHCPMCHKVLTNGGLCISCTHNEEKRKEEQNE